MGSVQFVCLPSGMNKQPIIQKQQIVMNTYSRSDVPVFSTSETTELPSGTSLYSVCSSVSFLVSCWSFSKLVALGYNFFYALSLHQKTEPDQFLHHNWPC